MCHEKAKWVLGTNARCLFGRLERAMTTNAISNYQIEYNCQNFVSVKTFMLPQLYAIDDPSGLIYSDRTALTPSLSPQVIALSENAI